MLRGSASHANDLPARVVPVPIDARRDWRGKRLNRAAAVIVLALAVLLLDAPPFLPGVASITGWADNASFNFPIRVETARQWREGRVPLWNPYQFAGFPLLGDITSGVLYPGNLPFVISPDGPRYRALDGVASLHFLLAALSMYVFARAVSLGRSAAALSGLVYAGNGFFLFLASRWIQAQSAVAWLPLILASVKLACLPGRFWRWSAIGAAAITLQILCGYPQYVFYTGLLAGLFALVIARDGAGWRPVLAVVLIYALGAALAAVQLLPATELAGLSRRGAGVSLEEFLLLPTSPSILRPLLIPRAEARVTSPNFVMGGMFIGTLAAVLAVEGARTARRIPLFLSGTLVVTLLLALGPATPIGELAYRIPGLNAFRYPFKHLLEVMFCVAALAGFGAQSVIDGRRGARTCVVIGALLVATWIGLPMIRFPVTHWALAVTVAGAIAFAALVLLDRRRMSIAVALASVWLGLAGNRSAVFLFARTPPSGQSASVETLAPRTRTILGPRFTSGVTASDTFSDLSPMLGLDYPTEFRLPSVNGTSPFGWPPLLKALALSEDGAFVNSRYLVDVKDQALDVLGVRYLVSSRTLIDGPILQDDPRAIVTERPNAQPALRFVDQVLCVDADATYKELHRKRYDFASVAFVDCERTPLPAGLSANPRSRITLLRGEPGLIQLQTRVPGDAPAMMIVSQADVPGWRARIDGRSTPIHRAYNLIQGIVVPPGRHDVELEYRPRSFVVGGFVSLTALLVLVGIGVRALRDRRAAAA